MANYDNKLSLHCISDNIIHIIIHIIKSKSSKCDKSGVVLSPQITVIKLIKLLLYYLLYFGGGGLEPGIPHLATTLLQSMMTVRRWVKII